MAVAARNGWRAHLRGCRAIADKSQIDRAGSTPAGGRRPCSPVRSPAVASNDPLARWLDLRLEDYRTALGEATASMARQQSVLSLGAAAEAVVAAAAFAQWPHRPQFGFITLLIAPCLALLIVALWATESARMVRAVRYVTGVEVQLAILFSGAKVPPPVHFNWINRPRPDDKGPLGRLEQLQWRARGGSANRAPWAYAVVIVGLLPLTVGLVIAGLVRTGLPTWATAAAAVGNVLVFPDVVGLMTFVARSPRLSDSPPLDGIAPKSRPASRHRICYPAAACRRRELCALPAVATGT